MNPVSSCFVILSMVFLVTLPGVYSKPRPNGLSPGLDIFGGGSPSLNVFGANSPGFQGNPWNLGNFNIPSGGSPSSGSLPSGSGSPQFQLSEFPFYNDMVKLYPALYEQRDPIGENVEITVVDN